MVAPIWIISKGILCLYRMQRGHLRSLRNDQHHWGSPTRITCFWSSGHTIGTVAWNASIRASRRMYEIGLSCGMSKKEQEDDNRGGNEQADNGPVDDEHRRQKCRGWTCILRYSSCKSIYSPLSKRWVHTTIGCGKQGFPSAQPYLSHTIRTVSS